MTDRELLEWAAKAAGIALHPTTPGSPLWIVGYGVWDPLTDDGDAMRLAVRRRMTLTFRDAGVVKEEDGYKPLAVAYTADFYGDALVEHWADASEAMRRAIVVCAAEIGRRMEG